MSILRRIVKRVELESRIALPIARKLPDFLIIGAQKGGTTSLYDYLIQHPDISSAFRKEVHFFDKNYDRGISWYKSFFPFREKVGITGEASPFYLYHPLVPKRVKEELGNIKLIVLLRDPVQRTFSHYKMEKRRGIEKHSFQEALEMEEQRLKEGEGKLLSGKFSHNHQFFSYLDRGKYADQLERWFEIFPRENIYIAKSESFFSDPQSTYNEVLHFLGLEPKGAIEFTPLNTDKSRTKIPKENMQFLNQYFQTENKKLVNLIGDKFSW